MMIIISNLEHVTRTRTVLLTDLTWVKCVYAVQRDLEI